MTEAAKREVSIEDEATKEIAADDPLFELSQIMGMDDDGAAEPSADIDPQIDLEEALLAELPVEPEVEPTATATDDPAPTAKSLEDELTSMLGDPVSVAAEVPAPDVETQIAENTAPPADFVPEVESFESADDELEATQLVEAVAETEIEMEQFSADVAPAAEFETPFDAELESAQAAIEPEAADAEPIETVAKDEDTTLSLEEAEIELEKDFAAFFDEELPDADLAPAFGTETVLQDQASAAPVSETSNPMDTLAGIGSDNAEFGEGDARIAAEAAVEESLQPIASEPEELTSFGAEPEASEDSETESIADEAAVQADIEHLNAGIEKIFGEQFANTRDDSALTEPEIVEPEMPAAPVLETTDMSTYESANAVEVDVPELPDLENEFVAAFEEDTLASEETTTEGDDAASSHAVTAAMGATIAAAGATVLSRRAGETAMAADEEAFDETRFEAELARDMEFVSHDLGNSDGEDLSLDDGLEEQVLAAKAAGSPPAKRGLVIAAVLGCVAIVGAIGLVAYSNSGVDGSDGPVLVEASPEPVKIEPENPGGVEVPNQDRAVFAENVVVPEQEELVPGVEEPVDIAAVPQTALPSNLNGGEAAAQKGDDRLVPEVAETNTPVDEIGALLAPRKVRTLVVRPDGTLVERTVVPTPEPVVSAPAPEPAAQTPEVVAAIPEPVATPPATETTEAAAPEVAAASPEPATTEPIVVTETAPEPSTPAPNEEVAAAPAAQPEVPEVETPTTEVAAAPAVQPETPAAPVSRAILNPPTIADRPNDQPLNIVNPIAQAANTQVAAAPAQQAAPARQAAPAAAAPAASPFSVQLASLPSRAAAQDSANNLARQYSSVIGGRGLAIREAQIEGRGTFYRVRFGASSRAEANQLCGQIKAAGGDCFVTR